MTAYHYDDTEAMRDMAAANRAEVDAAQDDALADLAHGMWDQDAAAAESYATARRREDEGLDR